MLKSLYLPRIMCFKQRLRLVLITYMVVGMRKEWNLPSRDMLLQGSSSRILSQESLTWLRMEVAALDTLILNPTTMEILTQRHPIRIVKWTKILNLSVDIKWSLWLPKMTKMRSSTCWRLRCMKEGSRGILLMEAPRKCRLLLLPIMLYLSNSKFSRGNHRLQEVPKSRRK